MEVKKFMTSFRTLTKKEKWILMLSFGALILLIVLPTGTNKTSKTIETTAAVITQTSDERFSYLQEYTDDLENRLLAVLKGVDGIGEMEVMITLKSSEEEIEEKNATKKTIMPEIEGVVITCTGGDSAVVIEEITEAVQALFSVQSHKIKVLKKS
jgi:stage III sporulation protein AG